MKKIAYITIIAASLLSFSCSRERMTKININPSIVDRPELSYLFSDALSNIQAQSYAEWFYDNAQYILPWTQVTVGNSGGSNGSNFNQMGAQGDRFKVFYDQIGGPLARIRNIVDNDLNGVEQASFQNIKALTYIVHIYHGIKVTDVMGSIPYSESLQAFYTNPPMFTPKYDTQKELLKEWDSELEASIKTLSNPVMYNGAEVGQVKLSAQQDFIYGGNNTLWVKLANTLRLKIAVRLLNTDQAEAFAIAESVVANGQLMNTLADEFYWYGGEQFYNFGNSIWHGVGSRNFINYLRTHRDPRLRFAFQKNDFNSMVMQGFLDQGVDIPSYILSEAIIDNTGATPKFMGWQGDGEPWVRYHGAPVTIKGEIPAAVENEYFTTSKFQLTIGSTVRTFSPISFFSRNMVQPDEWYTFPNVTVISDQYKPDGNYPYRTTLVSAAETQFYLAELKLKGANIPVDVPTLFRNGVTLSVESLNRNAKDLNIPEYNEPYDKVYGKAIKLESSEIPYLLSQPAYQLTGDTQSDLEKVYINLIVDRILTPTEVYVTARRSGVPKNSSDLWTRDNFSANPFPIPRRFVAIEPLKSNINYTNTIKAFSDQGFTVGTNDPSLLNTQRLWYDNGAPDFGNN